jgi:hypothetical protein
MKEVCSPISKSKGPTASNSGKLPASPGAFSDPGNVKRSDALPPRNLSDPDPHPAASRTGATINIALDARK